MKRGRNQRRRQGGGNNPNRALDSNGPDVRIRGTANQIYDKYVTLARDASSAGDRIKAESYLQHAEHYFRVIRATQPPQQTQPAADADGDQPPVSENAESNDKPQREDRGDNRRRNPRQNSRAPQDTDRANPAEKSSEDADASETKTTEVAESASAGEEVKEKPKRAKRPRRTTKRAVADKDGGDDDKDASTLAAE